MRDLTSQRAELHIKTRRLKLLFVPSGGLWICGGGAHTNVLARHTIASCQMPLIGTAERKNDTCRGGFLKRRWQVYLHAVAF